MKTTTKIIIGLFGFLLMMSIVYGAKVNQVLISPQVSYGENIDFCLDITYKDLPKVYASVKFPDNNEMKYILEQTDFDSKISSDVGGYCFKTLTGKEFRYEGFTVKGTGVYNVTFYITEGLSIITQKENFEVKKNEITKIDEVTVCKTVENVKSIDKINQVTMDIHGTEYSAGQLGKVWLQLLNGSDDPINDAICLLDIYNPDNSLFVSSASMTNYPSRGYFAYDLIIPNRQGVYPAIASCYFVATTTPYYASSSWVSQGTDGAGDYLNTFDVDTSMEVYTEATYLGGNPRKITAGYNFTGVTNPIPSVTLGMVVSWTGVWDSATNDDITVSIYNFTGNKWVDLPNTIISQGGSQTVSNSLLLSAQNLTALGYISSTGEVKVRFNDSFTTDTSNSNLRTDQVFIGIQTAGAGDYQNIKGNSELHITADKYYSYELDFGTLLNNTWLDRFELYYTVASSTTTTREDEIISLDTFNAFPCLHIFNVSLHNDTDDTYYALNFTTELNDVGTCRVNFPLTLDELTNYEIKVSMENIWKSELYHHNLDISLLNDLLEIACINYRYAKGLPDYPDRINSTLTVNDTFYQSCVGFFDAYNHYKGEYKIFSSLFNTNINFTSNEMLTLEAYYKETIDDGVTAQDIGKTVTQGLLLGNSYSIAILADPFPPTNPEYALYFANISSSYLNFLRSYAIVGETWNYPIRNLTYYETVALGNVSVFVNNTEIADAVWSNDNRTLSSFDFIINASASVNETAIANAIWNNNASINLGLLNQFADSIWSWFDRQLTAFGFDVVDEVKIAENVWNYSDRNLTYFPPALTAQEVWEYYSRNLTYYIEFDNLTAGEVWEYNNRTLSDFDFITEINESLISDYVWNNSNRQLTAFGFDIIDEELISLYVWNSSDRQLTAFTFDITNASKIWDYNNRTLSTFDFMIPVNAPLVAEYVWNNSNRTLNSFIFDTTDESLISDYVWNNSGRYTHGILLS